MGRQPFHSLMFKSSLEAIQMTPLPPLSLQLQQQIAQLWALAGNARLSSLAHPQDAKGCHNSTFTDAKCFTKNYSTATPSSSCIGSHQFGTHKFQIRQPAALDPQRHRRKPKRHQAQQQNKQARPSIPTRSVR